MQQRQVQVGVVAPDAIPVDPLEKLGLAELAGAPRVERGLHAARQHLEADRQIGFAGVQAGEHRGLPAMVRDRGMRFAEQHDRGALEAREDIRLSQRFAGRRIEPAPDLVAALEIAGGESR